MLKGNGAKYQKDCLEKDCTFIVWLLKDLIGGLLDEFYIRFETKKCVILITSNVFDSIKVVIKIFHQLSTCKQGYFFSTQGSFHEHSQFTR